MDTNIRDIWDTYTACKGYNGIPWSIDVIALQLCNSQAEQPCSHIYRCNLARLWNSQPAQSSHDMCYAYTCLLPQHIHPPSLFCPLMRWPEHYESWDSKQDPAQHPCDCQLQAPSLACVFSFSLPVKTPQMSRPLLCNAVYIRPSFLVPTTATPSLRVLQAMPGVHMSVSL